MFPGKNNKMEPFLAPAWRRAQPGRIVGPRHARPRAGAARGCGPAASGELTEPARDAGGMAGRDGGTGALIEPRNMD